MTTRDREVLDLLRFEPELLAIADAVAETQHAPRRLRVYRAVAAVAVAAVAIFVLVLASPWDRGGGKGLVFERALAAIEANGPVLHLTSRLEFTREGRTYPAALETESFYDKRKHLARIVSRREGEVVSDYTTTAVEDEFSAFPGLLDAADFYRRALATGRAKVVGEGTWYGRRVYWLDLERGGGFMLRIGIDRERYRPVVFRGLNPDGTPAGFRLAVLGFGYVSTAEAAFDTNAPVLVSGRVLGRDCRPRKARVGVFLSGEPAARAGAELASARTRPDGSFTLRVDPRKAGLPSRGVLDFHVNAQTKDGFGFAAFSRAVRNGVSWATAAPITVRVSKEPASSC